MSITLITFILLAIFLGAFIRTYFGFGEALISMPLLAIIGLDINSSISIIGLAGLTVAIFNILSELKHIKYKILSLMLCSSIIGIPIGIYILHHFNTAIIQIFLALFLLLYGTYAFCKRQFFKNNRKLVLQSPYWSTIAGIISGILGSLYNSHGVPIVIYATLSKWPIKTFKSTLQAHFLLTAIFVVIGQASGNVWTDKTIPIYLMSLPFLLLATIIGRYLTIKTPAHHFEKWVYLLMAALGLLLLFSI